MTDLILELVFNVVSFVLEDYALSDSVANRIFWGFVIAATVGVVWWDIR
jgi:hypothetical protein